jgi:NAD(P)-dependent dehydrogenase (short-subunit alcohol dehydrogenase family)
LFPQLDRQTVRAMANTLITGTSSGFGKLTALALAKRGHKVVATARDINGKNRGAADELRRIAETEKLPIHVVELDVTKDASVGAGVAAAIAALGHLDVVVQNAGYAISGLVETVTPAQMLTEFDTNVVGVHRVNRAVLPHLRERRSGLIVHLSSGLGRILLPLLGVYELTKWAIEAYSEVLRYELKPTGIDAVTVQPGAFPTEFGTNGVPGGDPARAQGYGPLAQGMQMMGARMQQMFSVPNPPNPQEVADAIVELIETPYGKRPARLVVDRFNGDAPRKLNDAHAAVQKALLSGAGMGMLAD